LKWLTNCDYVCGAPTDEYGTEFTGRFHLLAFVIPPYPVVVAAAAIAGWWQVA